MKDKRYKKWEEIVNPSLERTRKAKYSDPLEKEIDKAIVFKGETDSEGKKKEVTVSPETDTRGGVKETAPKLKDFNSRRPMGKKMAPEPEMTEEERNQLRKKRKALEGLMDEFVNWKESLKE